MSTILVYKKPSLQEVEHAIEAVQAWFITHPKRRVCRARLWAGQEISIKRGKEKETLLPYAAPE